jgi:hypothetical protein
MYLFLSVVMTALFLLNACASKSEKALIAAFNHDKAFYQKLMKTEKVQFYEKGITKILLRATYMGETKDGKEKFIVGMYRDDDIAEEPFTALLHLRLNGRDPLGLTKLDSTDRRIRRLPLDSPWLEYYLVIFPHLKEKRLRMEINAHQFGRAELHFAKIAKYMLDILK